MGGKQMSINVAWIEEQAVNANALKNGRAIYQSGKFIDVYKRQLPYGQIRRCNQSPLWDCLSD